MPKGLRAGIRRATRASARGLRLIFLALFACGVAYSQHAPAAPAVPPAPPVQLPLVSPVPPPPCIQPAPMVRWQDYEGPFAKTIGFFGEKLEVRVRSVRGAQYKPGVVLCTLTTKEKARLFVSDFTNPVTFVSAAFNSGISQAQNGDPRFGQGLGGYGERFGANLADQASNAFFKDLVYPTVFSQDARYYRLGRGGTGRRIVHALSHIVVAHHESGAEEFNYTEWLGTASTVALGSTYHGYRAHGAGTYAEAGAIDLANDAGFDILREFWPDIVHKLKLPFRTANQSQAGSP